MSKNSTEPRNIFGLIGEGTAIYLKNFIPLSKAMLFPVFGLVFGIIWIFLITAFFRNYISNLKPADVVQMLMIFLVGLGIILLPGFVLLLKGFWEYMIIMVSLNSMIGNMRKQGNINDIKIHNQAVKYRSREYIGLLLILSLIWFIGLLLPAFVFLAEFAPIQAFAIFAGLEILFTFILIIVSVYLSLCFQVFAFENISSINVLKRSWNLVEGNFWRTLILGILLFLVTGWLIPFICQILIENTPLITIFIQPFKIYTSTIITNPEIITNALGNFIPTINIDPIAEISKSATLCTIGLIITAFLLPLGSACYTLLYFDIVNRKSSGKKK